jgi:hypothetical protein
MTNIWSLNNSIIPILKKEKLNKKDFVRRLIQEVLDKKKQVRHLGHLESNIMYLKRIRYHKKKCESPKYYNKQDLPYGTLLVGHEKMYRNAINLDIR